MTNRQLTLGEPVRIQRRRTKGWRAPDGARYVGRGTLWGSPYPLGQTQVRMPAVDGSEWEHEGRSGKASGEMHHYKHPDGTVTWHQVETATSGQVVELYRRWLAERPELIEAARRELAGRDLMCWCPPGQPCHADVLLEIANEPPCTPAPVPEQKRRPRPRGGRVADLQGQGLARRKKYRIVTVSITGRYL